MHTRRGFTLIELLVVMLVVGLLAAIAAFRLRDARGRAVDDALRSDLRNLIAAQEAHVQERGRYAGELAALDFAPSEGVALAVVSADGTGWAATASHPNARLTRCAIFVGRAPAPEPATVEGLVACR